MVRDTIKPLLFWKKKIDGYKLQIEKYEEILRREIDDKKKLRIKRRIYHEYFCLLISQYSAGEEKCIIRDTFSKSLKIMSIIWTPASSYVEMLWMISLGVLLDIDDMDVQSLRNVYEQYGIDDAILSYLIRYLDPSIPKSERVLFEQPYNLLSCVVTGENDIDKERMMLQYLDGWYDGHDDVWWYASHQTDGYIGYWSFETAAIAKILKMDVSNLEKREFFPRF